jgi:hypothetical protein
MGKLFGLVSQTSDYHEILRMAWATKHPYLFTLIEIANPTLFIILIIAGFNMVNGIFRRKQQWQRGR